MENFNYYNGTRYIFGKNTESEVGKYLKKYGATKVLIHYGSNHAKSSGLVDKVVDSIKSVDIKYVELGGVQPNPRDELVYKGIDLCRKEKVDFILAVGGGSVIDSAKAIGLGYYYEGDFFELFEKQEPYPNCLPIGVILTIAAAGSESSTNSVISFESRGLKRGFSSECERPKFAILNPELTYSLPFYQTSAGITDIISHLLERYFSKSKDCFVSQRMIEGVIQAIIFDSVPRLVKDPKDYGARSNIMWAGTLAHNNIFGVDRVQDWCSHKLEHELSAKYDVTHGAGLATVFPAWMLYNFKVDIDLFYCFATRIMHVKENENDKESVIITGIKKYKEFLHDVLKMPTNFEELGAKEEDIPYLAKNLFVDQPKVGNFKQIDENDAINIYKLMLK